MKNILLSLCFLFAGAAAYAGCGPNGGPCGSGAHDHADGKAHSHEKAEKSCCGKCGGDKKCDKEAKSCCGKCGGDKMCSAKKSCCGTCGGDKKCDKEAKSCCGKCGGDKKCTAKESSAKKSCCGKCS